MKRQQRNRDFEYDVCLSFAGEDRAYVEQVADALRNDGVRVFYDKYEQAGLWGKDLYEHLDDIYQNSARYCVLFVSKRYAKKVWTNHERRSAQERALREHKEYILPALFDNTEIPGLRKTVGHIKVAEFTPRQFAHLIAKKIGNVERRNYLPPTPDRLLRAWNARSAREKELVIDRAHTFLSALARMSAQERELIFAIFQEGCTTEVPRNVHINIDLLRRVTDFPISKIRRLLVNLRSLGFVCNSRIGQGNFGTSGTEEIILLEWYDLTFRYDQENDNATRFAGAMIACATEGLCPVCSTAALRRMDFSQLATRTTSKEKHNKTS